jgi:hypothetical protein
VAPVIQSFIHNALSKCQTKEIEQRKAPWLASLQRREPRVLQSPPDENQAQVRTNLEINKDSLNFNQHNIMSDARAQPPPSYKIPWLTDPVRELKREYDVFQDREKERIEISSGTCDWILAKPVYKDFIASPRNGVLLVFTHKA